MSNTTSTLPVITPGNVPTTTAQSPAITSSGLLHAAGDYFETTNGQAVYLAGDHTWSDNTSYASTGHFDFNAYTDDLHSEGANFTRLWAPDSFANATNSNFGTADQNVFQYAAGSTTKFDLTQFNQSYFDNLLSNVQTAAAKGVYVDVMLFFDYNPPGANYGTWASNPWNGTNNVNGTLTDNVAIEQGADPHTMALQQAYVAKVLDTLKDQPNVLYEVTNESSNDQTTLAWQNKMVDFIHQYESSHGYLSHPAGITAPYTLGDPQQTNAALMATDANWISPTGGSIYQSNPPAATGTKVLVADTDHIFGMGGNSDWVWQQFTRGNNVLMMDDEAGTSLPGVLNTGISGGALSNEISERLGVTETRTVSQMVNMTGMTPDGGLSSTGFALINQSAGDYVFYAPNGGGLTVDLSGVAGKTLTAEWLNVGTGQMTSAGTVTGGTSQRFTATFSGSAALILTPTSESSTGSTSNNSSSGTSGTGTVSTAPPSNTTGPIPPLAAPINLVTPTIGSGPDTLKLAVSQDYWNGSADFTVDVNGKQIGGLQAVDPSVLHSASGTETFTFQGTFGSGTDNISVNYTNDAWGGSASTDRNLYVTGVSVDGTASSLALPAEIDITEGKNFNVSVPTPTPTPLPTPTPTPTPTPVSMTGPAVGSGLDTLTLGVSQDAWNGNAEFTVNVNGNQIGGVQNVDSSVLNSANGTETFTFKGDFGTEADTVQVSYINDAWGGTSSTDRNLYVNSVSINGTATSSRVPTELDITEAKTFSVSIPTPAPVPTPTPVPPPTPTPTPVSMTGPTIGSGPDTLTLGVSQDYYQGSAEFTVNVNGQQIGGVQTVDASVLHNAGGTEAFTLKGDFSTASGAGNVQVSFLNDAWGGSASADRNLYVTSVAVDGVSPATQTATLLVPSTATFNVAMPAAPPPAPTPAPVGLPSILPTPSATVLTVGANGEYQTLAAAAQQAVDGDTIYVQGGTYTNDFASISDFTPSSGSQKGITIQAVGGQVSEVATVPPPNEKALLDEYGNVTVNGFSFSGVAISSSNGGNGAGIRYEGGNLTLNDDYFYNNQDGLLGNADPNGTITVNNSQFSNNGSGSGYTHNIYVGDINNVTVENSTFSGANAGHEFKSRAQSTTLLFDNFQDGASGTASYGVDTPNGGQLTMIGDTVQKSPNAGNPVMITTGEEGAYSNSNLIIAGNTLINNDGSGNVGLRNSGASAVVTDNAIYGLSSSQLTQGSGITATGNTFEVTSAAPALNTTTPFSAGVTASLSFISGLGNSNPGAAAMLQSDISAANLSASDVSSSANTIASAILGTGALPANLNTVSTALAGYINNMRAQTAQAVAVAHS